MLREMHNRKSPKQHKPKSSHVSPTQIMWGVYMHEVRKHSSGDVILPCDKSPFNDMHCYDGVVTHPTPTFTKDINYQHTKLTKPSHLWCDITHATDSDVLHGYRYHSKNF